eukprot:293678_1
MLSKITASFTKTTVNYVAIGKYCGKYLKYTNIMRTVPQTQQNECYLCNAKIESVVFPTYHAAEIQQPQFKHCIELSYQSCKDTFDSVSSNNKSNEISLLQLYTNMIISGYWYCSNYGENEESGSKHIVKTLQNMSEDKSLCSELNNISLNASNYSNISLKQQQYLSHLMLFGITINQFMNLNTNVNDIERCPNPLNGHFFGFDKRWDNIDFDQYIYPALKNIHTNCEDKCIWNYLVSNPDNFMNVCAWRFEEFEQQYLSEETMQFIEKFTLQRCQTLDKNTFKLLLYRNEKYKFDVLKKLILNQSKEIFSKYNYNIDMLFKDIGNKCSTLKWLELRAFSCVNDYRYLERSMEKFVDEFEDHDLITIHIYYSDNPIQAFFFIKDIKQNIKRNKNLKFNIKIKSEWWSTFNYHVSTVTFATIGVVLNIICVFFVYIIILTTAEMSQPKKHITKMLKKLILKWGRKLGQYNG